MKEAEAEEVGQVVNVSSSIKQTHVQLSHGFIIAQFVLRILIVALTLIAAVVMATSSTQISIAALGINLTARYDYSSAFKYLMGVDILVCVLVFLTLVAGFFLYHRKQSILDFLYCFFLHDLVLMVLMTSACGAATAIGYVAMNGQPETLWFSICNRAGNFCLKNGISVGLSHVAFLCLFALTIMSSYKLYK